MSAMQGATPERVITPIKMAALQVTLKPAIQFETVRNGKIGKEKREKTFHDFFRVHEVQ